jgi:hypothetical protein
MTGSGELGRSCPVWRPVGLSACGECKQAVGASASLPCLEASARVLTRPTLPLAYHIRSPHLKISGARSRSENRHDDSLRRYPQSSERVVCRTAYRR